VSAQLAARRPGGQVVLAVDGKAVRGARTSDGTAGCNAQTEPPCGITR
jgi:hypothetical protein